MVTQVRFSESMLPPITRTNEFWRESVVEIYAGAEVAGP
jgi:hypothetical protein